MREEKSNKAAKLVKRVAEASPRTVNMIFMVVGNLKKTESGNIIDDSAPKQFSLEEAVTHQIECDFSKEQYSLNRKRLSDKNCKVFPSYDRIAQYKEVSQL